MSERKKSKPKREPRPLAAFFISLGISAVLLGGLLATDGRVLQLRKAKADLVDLERRIAVERKENARLTAAIDSAKREEFPAEKVAREELNLVHPEDVVLLYPDGSLSGEKEPTPVATAVKRATLTPSPTARAAD